MVLSSSILVIWIGYIFLCYYLIYRVQNIFIRSILTMIPCSILTLITCENLPHFYASSIITVTLCWLTSIRLFDLIVFSPRNQLRFQLFLLKILWIYFPIQLRKSARNQWSILFQLILFVVKLLINHWIYRWSINCETRISFERIFLFYLSLLTLSSVLDFETVCIRILTRDKYTMEAFTNFPIFSLSLREFWGRRYNQLVNTILKKSIFEPVRLRLSSSTAGGLITFIISGLLHVHIVYVTFGDRSFLFPTFMFFFLHGIACCVEGNMKIQFPEHVRWLITHTFLLITAPLMIGPFISEGSTFSIHNPPPLIDVQWIPKIPLPNSCP